MKTVLLLLAAATLLAVAESRASRGCIYILGRCARECEEGTHAYALGCDYLLPERTCDNPNPELDMRGKLCDYSRCECDEPKVKDLTTRTCVLLEDCPKKTDSGGEKEKVTETDRV